MSPLVVRSISRTSPSATVTTHSRPSWLAPASSDPSGAAARSSTRPSPPSTTVRVCSSDALHTSMASSPLASVTQATSPAGVTHDGEAAAHVGARCQCPHRAVAVGDPRDRAAHLDGARPSIDGGRDGAELMAGVDRSRHRRLALAAEVDVDRRGAATIPQPDVAAALEHGTPTVGRGMADVERGLGELAQIADGSAAGRRAVAPPTARSARRRSETKPIVAPSSSHSGDSSGAGSSGEQALEGAIAVAVEPELRRRAAAVTLPPRDLDGSRRGRQHGAARGQGDVADESVRQPLRQPTVEADGIGGAAAAAALAAMRRCEHPTVGGPAERPSSSRRRSASAGDARRRRGRRRGPPGRRRRCSSTPPTARRATAAACSPARGRCSVARPCHRRAVRARCRPRRRTSADRRRGGGIGGNRVASTAS